MEEHPKPSIGRIVHYVLPEGRSAGESRPAIVVRVWGPESQPFAGSVQLQVFTDAENDGLPPVAWKTSVAYGPEGKPGTWHWPPRT